MKLVLIAYNEALDDEVLEVMAEAGAETYTKWTKVLGKGNSSGPHLATHVWPKQNNILAVCLEDQKAFGLLAGVQALREELGREGVKAFLLPVEAAT